MKPRTLLDLLHDAAHRLVLGERRARLLALGLALGASSLIAWVFAQAWVERPLQTVKVEAACEAGGGPLPETAAAATATEGSAPPRPAGNSPRRDPGPRPKC